MSYEADAPWRLTSQVQLMLGVTVDGVWGSETASAYRMARPEVRARIDALLAGEQLSAYSVQRVTTSVPRPGVSPPASLQTEGREPTIVSGPTPGLSSGVSGSGNRSRSPRSAPLVAKADGSAQIPSGSAAKIGTVVNRLVDWYTEEQLAPVIRAAVAGLQHATYDRMVRKLKLEAGQIRVGGVTFYNARSVNGRYRGLFQMGQAAWTDVQRKLGHTYDSVFDPAINARAAALYIENNVRVARNLGYTGAITDDVLYAMHNQGVTGFLRVANGGKVEGNQSAAARRVIADAARRV